MGWSPLTFDPDEETVAEVATAWDWLIGDRWTPAACSLTGDIFLEKETGGVFWLDCGLGVIDRIADDTRQFSALTDTERGDEWLMPGLVEDLRETGKRPGPGQCYSFTILPVFAEGSYALSNIYVVSAREHFGLTGSLHRQIQYIHDGGQLKVEVAP